MQRVIAVPDNIPDEYIPLIVVYGKPGTGEIIANGDANIIGPLSRKEMGDRMRVIKQICSNIELMLLQSSSVNDN